MTCDPKMRCLEISETTRARVLRCLWRFRGDRVDSDDIFYALGIGAENNEAKNAVYTLLRRLEKEHKVLIDKHMSASSSLCASRATARWHYKLTHKVSERMLYRQPWRMWSVKARAL